MKAHAKKKTCPRSLRYNVRVNIAPDDDFKTDINNIRKEAEQKLVGAHTRFHYRKTEQKMKLTNSKGRKMTMLNSLKTGHIRKERKLMPYVYSV